MLDVSDHPKVIDAERKGVHFESRRRWYALDDADRITHVSPGWSEPVNKLLGRTIWEFFSGTATHHIYKNIFQSIRGKRATASLAIRCDQPDRLIELRVVVSGGADRQLLVTFETLREAPTEYQSLWDPAAVRSRL